MRAVATITRSAGSPWNVAGKESRVIATSRSNSSTLIMRLSVARASQSVREKANAGAVWPGEVGFLKADRGDRERLPLHGRVKR